MRKNIHFVVVFAFSLLLTCSIFNTIQWETDSDDPEEKRLEGRSDSNMIRSSESSILPVSSKYFSVNDPYWIGDSRDLKSEMNNFLAVDDLEYEEMNRIPAFPPSLHQSSSSRMAISHNNEYIVAFIDQTSPYGFDFKLSLSVDQGSFWSTITVLSMDDIGDPSVEIMVHEDKFFFLSSFEMRDLSNIYEIHIKVTPFANIWNISSVASKEYSIPARGLTTQFGCVYGGMFIFAKTESFSRPMIIPYSNGTWLPTSYFPYSTHSFSAVFMGAEHDGELRVYFLHNNARTLLKMVSINSVVDQWSGIFDVFSTTTEIGQVITFTDGEMVYGAVDLIQLKEMATFEHDGVNSCSIGFKFDYEWNGGGTDHRSSMGGRNDDIMIMLEGSNGQIELFRSFDNGGSYHVQEIFSGGSSLRPSLSSDLSLVVYMNGTDLQVGEFKNAIEGRMITEKLFFHGATSWDQVAFSIDDAEVDGSFEFRVLDSNSNQIFPDQGFLSIHGSPSGNLGRTHYEHICEISNMNISEEENGLQIEFQFNNVNEDPSLFAFLINYTVEYPCQFDIDDDLGVISTFNTQITEMGLELAHSSDSGEAIIGPFVVEDEVPHHLWAKGAFLNIENYCTFSIIGSNLQEPDPLVDFTSALSDRLDSSGEFVHLKWGLKNLGEIPVHVSEFYVLVTMVRSGTLSPRLSSLRLEYSMAPTIINVSIEDDVILRNRTTKLHIFAEDREDPSHHLLVETRIMSPDEEEWTDMGMDGAVWNGLDWEVVVNSDIFSETGNYSFKVNAIDRFGRVSEDFVLMDFLKIENIKPLPPLVRFLPIEPRPGDKLSMEMVRPGEDEETTFTDIRYNVYVFLDGSLDGNHLNLTTLDMEFDEISIVKDHTWTIMVTTWDGLEESEPFIQEIHINNTPPYVEWDGSAISILEDQIDASIDPSIFFVDIDYDLLEFNVRGSDQLSPFVENDMIGFDLEQDFHGKGWIEVNAYDGVVNTTINVTIDVEPVNDLPIWNHIDDLVVHEGDWIHVDIGAIDLRDHESPSVSMNDFVSGLNKGKNLLTLPNGSFSFKPDNSMIGLHQVEITIEDLSSKSVERFNLTVLNTNQPPTIPLITIERGSHVIGPDEDLILTAKSTDPDEVWGDGINYSWMSSIDGILGNGPRMDMELSVGEHIIDVIATDSEGASNTTVITIEVLDRTSDDGSVLRTWILYSLSAIIPLFLGIILGIFILIIIKNRKRAKENEDPSSASTETPGSDLDVKSGGGGKAADQLPGGLNPLRVLPPHNNEIENGETQPEQAPGANSPDRMPVSTGQARNEAERIQEQQTPVGGEKI